MKIIKTFLILIVLCATYPASAYADKCKDYLLLAGDEPITSYGLDTTRHWWAITQPYTSGYRLIVDGKKSSVFQEIRSPIFSPDGEKWAAFAQDNTGQWRLILQDTVVPINCSSAGEIYFGQSGAMICAYRQGANEFFAFKGAEYRSIDRASGFFISCDGNRYAYSAKRGANEVIVSNDGESELYDATRLIGIWLDGAPVFVAQNGGQSRLYKGKEALSRAFDYIASAAINNECSAVAIVGSTKSGAIAQLYSDEYYEALESRNYEAITDLVIHPTKPMYSCVAQSNGGLYVVFNGVEYDAGRECGKPFFTCNGSELIFAGVDQQYFITINGKRYVQPTAIDLARKYAVKPNSSSYAYGSSAGLVARDMQKNISYSGVMVDEATSARYNWREERYEALGRINQRLFLLSCEW